MLTPQDEAQQLVDLLNSWKEGPAKHAGWKLLSQRLERLGLRWEYFV